MKTPAPRAPAMRPAWIMVSGVLALALLLYAGATWYFHRLHECAGVTDRPIEQSRAFGTFVMQHADGWAALYELKPDFTYRERLFASLDDLIADQKPLHDFPAEPWMFDPDCPSDRAPLFLRLEHAAKLTRNATQPENPTVGAAESSGALVDVDAAGHSLLVLDYRPDGTWDKDGGLWATQVNPRAGGGYEGIEEVKRVAGLMRRAERTPLPAP